VGPVVPLFYLCERTERRWRLARDSTDPGLRSLLSLAEEYAAKADDQGVS
jgi:hypothetical protein